MQSLSQCTGKAAHLENVRCCLFPVLTSCIVLKFLSYAADSVSHESDFATTPLSPSSNSDFLNPGSTMVLLGIYQRSWLNNPSKAILMKP